MTTFALGQIRRLPIQHARPAILLAGCVSLVMALLLTAVTAAVGLRGLAGLGGLIGGNRLDYDRGPLGEFFPLTDGFVEDTLGPGFSRTPGAPVPAFVPVESSPIRATTPPAEHANGGDSANAAPLRDETSTDLGNNDFASAYAVRGLPYSSKNSAPSDRQPGEPTSCASAGGTTWFRFTPSRDIGLTATTAGSDLSTAVGVFTGTTLPTLRQESCDSDPSGDAATTFSARRGTTYWFQVTRTLGSGAVVFGLDLRATTTVVREVDGINDYAAVSGNGRYVVYLAEADLASIQDRPCGDGGTVRGIVRRPCQQVYVRDLRTGATELISSPDHGETGGDEDSDFAAITPDGRFVAFSSLASDLVPDDENDTRDAFVRDRVTGRTTRVSVTSEGAETHSGAPPGTVAISADGRFVAFLSDAPELTKQPPASFTCCLELFVHDTATGQTELVSTDGGVGRDAYVGGLSADGQRLAFSSRGGVYVSDRKQRRVETVSVSYTGADVTGTCLSGQCLSADGRYAIFQSPDPAVADDTNGHVDVFVRDLVNNRTTRVSVASSGAQSHASADPVPRDALVTFTAAAISPDGLFVAFSSSAEDLAPGDDNNRYDVFVHDLRRRTTSRVSVLDDGSQSESGTSYQGSVSNNARTVVFSSEAFTAQDGPRTSGIYARQRSDV
ncbi:MAG TPA: hypothetical protein VNB94_05605 [Mycobacteriales bacterium]|nr:hypothetical protein [Mycobacteriales bacterium]